MHTYIPSVLDLPPTTIPSLYIITEHQAEFPVLCSNFPQLSILHLYYIYMCVYVCVCTYLYVSTNFPICPTLPFTPLCLHVCSILLCLYSSLGNRFICTIFLGSTYMLSIWYLSIHIQMWVIKLIRSSVSSMYFILDVVLGLIYGDSQIAVSWDLTSQTNRFSGKNSPIFYVSL